MKVKLLLLLFSFLFIGVFSCKEKEEPIIVNEEPVVKEEASNEEVKSSYDSKSLVGLETLPEWMQNEIKAYIEDGGLFAYWVTFKGKWEGQTIYYVHNVLQSCYCDYRYEDGKEIEESSFGLFESAYYEDGNGSSYPNIPNENWTIIYEYKSEMYIESTRHFK